jgi:cyanophycin synthetase
MRDPRPTLLWGYALFRRGMSGSMHPDVRRMRELRDAFYLDAWRRAADGVGAKLERLSASVAEISGGGRRLRVSGNVTSIDDPVTLQLAADKPAVYGLLADHGIPVPRHMVLDAAAAMRAARLPAFLPRPLVVKPAADTGAGTGVSTNVRTPGQMRRAAAWARAFAQRIVVESQIEGDCYRVLLLDGEVLDVVLRRPPRVAGDGRSTVRELVRRENRRRLEIGTQRAQVLVRHDPDLVNTLAAQGLRPRSRPPAGQAVELKRAINDNSADENEAATDRLCPEILDAARLAAKVLGQRFAGVDVVCRDPDVPLDRSGGVVLEVNGNPGFHYHYHRSGPGFPVAERLLQRLFVKNVEYAD